VERASGTASFMLSRRVIAALLAAAGLALVSLPAQAAGRPAAAAASQANLSGVSCSSADTCMAVGTLLKGSPVTKGFTLAERWDGHAWTVKNTPNPRGSTNSKKTPPLPPGLPSPRRGTGQPGRY
jgi:hypothetical protein